MANAWLVEGVGKKTDQAFILMPFSEKWSTRIWTKLKEIFQEFGLYPKRADEIYGHNILDDIKKGILESRVVLADITNKNPNVLYELGASHALGKDVVIISQSADDIPFDLRVSRCVLYEDNSDGYEKLREQIPLFLTKIFTDGLVDNFGSPINERDRVITFVSTGGVDRCVIACAICRHKADELLRKQKSDMSITFVSCGSYANPERLGAQYASAGAQGIIKQELNKDYSKHRTKRADFDIYCRSDLIVCFEGKKFVDNMPQAFAKKAVGFLDLFGGDRAHSDFDDPYEGTDADYKRFFDAVNSTMQQNFDKLMDLLFKTS